MNKIKLNRGSIMAKIKCDTMENFIAVVAGLTRENLVFTCYTESLTIIIEGY